MTTVIPAENPRHYDLKVNMREEFERSIKSREAEDRLDLCFYRPLGFWCAKLGAALRVSPNQITLASMATGIAAGALFSRPGFLPWSLAGLLLLASGVLDSADGQLARITGRASPVGLVLDGICDTVVFIAVYLGCLTPLFPVWGASLWAVAVAAGMSHSCQSATFDFYLREYLYYALPGHPESYRNPSLTEAAAEIRRAGPGSWFWRARLLWLRQQQLFNLRDESFRQKMRAAMQAGDPQFRAEYRRYQIGCLRQWRWLGSNSHTMGILLFAYLGRFDLYLIGVNLIALNTWLLASWWRQQIFDRRLVAEIENGGLIS